MFYTQLSAEFGKSIEEIKHMTYLEVYCATVYVLENPPAGTVIKAVVEAYCEGSKGTKGRKRPSSDNSSNESFESDNDGGELRPANWDELTKEQQYAWEKRQLDNLMAQFGMAGGVLRKGKKGA